MNPNRNSKGAPADDQFAGPNQIVPGQARRRMVISMTSNQESIAPQAAPTQPPTAQPADTRPRGMDEIAARRQAMEASVICTWTTPRKEVRRLLRLGTDIAALKALEQLCYFAFPDVYYSTDTARVMAEWLLAHRDWYAEPKLFTQCAEATSPSGPVVTDSPSTGVLALYQPPPNAPPSSGPSEGEAVAEWLGRHAPGAPLTVLQAVEEVVDVLGKELTDAGRRITNNSPKKQKITERMLERFARTGKQLSHEQRAWRLLNLPDGRPSLALSQLVFGYGRQAGQTRRKTDDMRIGLYDSWVHSATGPAASIIEPGESYHPESVPPVVARLWAQLVAQVSADMEPEPAFEPEMEPEPEPEMSMV